MNSFEVYQTYVALKQHFNDLDYDFFKYHGKSTANLASFNKRKDRIFFEKIASFKNPGEFLLANFLKNKHIYIRDLAYSQFTKDIHIEWLKRKESLTYLFKTDLNKICDQFNASFKCERNTHPVIIKLYLRNEITLETLCILVDLTKCIPYWDKRLEGDTIYDEVRLLIIKYQPFLKYDKKAFSKLVKTTVRSV